jgi:hypothetical protein
MSTSATVRVSAARDRTSPVQAHSDGDGRALPSRSRQEQEGEADQREPERVGHEQVLELELVGVEQERRRGRRRQPPRHAEPAQQRVHAHADQQTEQVLHHRDDGEPLERHERLQEERVADGSHVVRIEVERHAEVGVGVAVEPQDGVVGEEDEHTQHGGGRQQDDERPVPTEPEKRPVVQREQPVRERGYSGASTPRCEKNPFTVRSTARKRG